MLCMQENLKCRLGTGVQEGANVCMIGDLVHATHSECTMYDLSVFTEPPTHALLHSIHVSQNPIKAK